MYAQGPMSTSIASNGPLPLITYVILYHVLYCTLLLSVTGENKPKPKPKILINSSHSIELRLMK